MFRSRGENLRSVFVLLFLNVAFFMLEQQDPEKYARVFRFDWSAVMQGEVWRLLTWQFTQAGTGWLEALSLFVTLLLLYLMGTAMEEEWGTRHFLTLFLLSTLGAAGVAAWLGIPLLGTYFVYYTLLFVYAAAFPGQTLLLFAVIPIRVRLIAIVSCGALVFGVFAGGRANIAALTGALLGLVYFLMNRAPAALPPSAAPAFPPVPPVPPRIDTIAMHNAARWAAVKHVSSHAEVERLIAQCERDTVPGVNVCPPADYKPDHTDGYCIRCEGFAECSARYLRSRVPAATSIAAATTAAPAPAPEPAPLV
ncbi:MAG TPA: rhomboid family intramembrane serine protease [Thermoanaerobaculia bacterium]|jgi:membrane associated rhomboid family serine protease